MKIKDLVEVEISNKPYYDDEFSQYELHFSGKRGKVINLGKFDTYDVKLCDNKSEFYTYGAFDKDELIAILQIVKIDFYQISITHVKSDFKRQGIISILFAIAMKKFKQIVSDITQSNEAKSFWQALIKNQAYDIHVIQPDNGIYNIVNIPTEQVWQPLKDSVNDYQLVCTFKGKKPKLS